MNYEAKKKELQDQYLQLKAQKENLEAQAKAIGEEMLRVDGAFGLLGKLQSEEKPKEEPKQE